MPPVNWNKEFSRALRRLRRLARRSSEADARSLNVSIKELSRLKTIVDDVEWLGWDLHYIDHILDRCRLSAMEGEQVDLVLSVLAVAKISRFLRKRAPSAVIDVLKGALSQLVEGSRPAMFRGRKGGGRRTESALIHQVKGLLAGLVYVQQKSGMSRRAAASWIARHIPPELASRLSSKPITDRAVLEWIDRYGGEHPPDNPGGDAFKVWSRPFEKPLTVETFTEITRGIAELIPARR